MTSVVISVFFAFVICDAALATTEKSNPLPEVSHQFIQPEKATLVIGSEQDYPPFATGITDETAGGFTVDLWKAVAAEAGLNYTIRVLPFHRLLQEFKEGRIDVLINLAQSEERHHFADFTVPHVVVHGAIFVRKGDTNIRTEDDLAAKKIIVLNADLAHDYAVSKGWGKQLVLVDTAAEGMKLLSSGKYDAMLLGKLAGMQTLQKMGLTNVEPLKVKAGFSQKFSFAVAEGRSKLLEQINDGFALTKSSGTYQELYDQWFGAYEVKEVGLNDILKYLIPVVAFFLFIAGYFFYRRQVERELSAAELLNSRNLLATIIETAPIRVFWKDKDLRYLGCNTIFAKDSGSEQPDDVIGKDDYQLGWSAQADMYREDDRAVMESGVAKLNYEEPQSTPSGNIIWLSTSKVPLKNSKGETIGLLGIYQDITEQKNDQEKIQQFAFYDALTKLPNRRLLQDRLSQAMSSSKRSGCYGALMFIDLDNFKPLNDEHGHRVGDLLLMEAANRLRGCVREMDTVARFGGDEFVVVLSELDAGKSKSITEAYRIAEKIRSTLYEPYLLAVSTDGSTDTTVKHQCTASIGVVLFVNHEYSQEEILEWADDALYLAKESGRNQIRFYEKVS
ncbi:MAG: transporter substrate-binding domain-containing protein [Nitrosomonadales bacterium]|nr:transporter substrate-binding domain-containing protein [Nitrosomonadales bacterium]